MRQLMQKFIATNFALLLFFGLATTIFADETSTATSDVGKKDEDKDPNTFKVYWKDGIRLDSADGSFKLRLGGRIQNDWMWGSAGDGIADAFGDIVSGNEFRSTRLYVEGEIYSNVEFKAQYDFAGGDVDLKDVYIGLKDLPFGTLRAGHFKAGFSLEELTSSKYTNFMERSLPNLFAAGREVGFGVNGYYKSERFTWNFGVFTDADDYGNAKAHDDAYLFAGRITFLPWVDGKNLLHLGGALLYRDLPDGGAFRYSSRAENHLLPRYVDTHNFSANSSLAIGLEAAYITGSFHAGGEYMIQQNDAPDFDDPEFKGFYAYAGWFLTGETRNYKKSAGTWDRNKPNKPYGHDGGTGAWEVLLRYSQLDLTDALINGGELKDITFGLNWYLNNNTRVMFNYIHANRSDIDNGTANIILTRFQIDF